MVSILNVFEFERFIRDKLKKSPGGKHGKEGKKRNILNTVVSQDAATILEILCEENRSITKRVEEIAKKKELVTEFKIHPERLIDLVVVAVKERAIRCKIVATGALVTLREVRSEVHGEILTVKLSKVRRYGKTYYMSDEVESEKIDIPALYLEPLVLKDEWIWDPEEEYWGELDKPINPYLKPVIKFGRRRSYEMEQILPWEDIEDPTGDPIVEASEHHERGTYDKAFNIMENILT